MPEAFRRIGGEVAVEALATATARVPAARSAGREAMLKGGARDVA
jgi:hypothetical protein